MTRILKSIVLLLLISIISIPSQGMLFAAAFNKPTNLINTPIYEEIVIGDLEFGLSDGIASGSEMDFDYKLDYSLTNRFKIGFAILNVNDLVGNIHFNLDEQTIRGKKVKFAAGLLNISGQSNISSWDNFESGIDNNFSPYFVTLTEFDKFDLHTGYGKREFQGIERTGLLSGLFYGVELKKKFAFGGNAMAEYDGKDMNIGYKFFLGPRTTLKIAFTEILNGKENENYNNAPTRRFTFGLTFKENMFLEYRDKKGTSLDKKYQELDDMQYDIQKFQSNYLTTYQKLKKDKHELSKKIYNLKKTLEDENKYVYHVYPDTENSKIDHLKNKQELEPEVIRLYYDSFDYYSKQEYYQAITALIKAININPYVSELYTRLGSVYYELDLEDDAIAAWEKALALDPNNLELVNFLAEFDQ